MGESVDLVTVMLAWEHMGVMGMMVNHDKGADEMVVAITFLGVVHRQENHWGALN